MYLNVSSDLEGFDFDSLLSISNISLKYSTSVSARTCYFEYKYDTEISWTTHKYWNYRQHNRGDQYITNDPKTMNATILQLRLRSGSSGDWT